MLSVKDCLCREAGFRLLEREERDTRQSVSLAAYSLGISQFLDVTDDLDRVLESVAPVEDAKKQKTQKELKEKITRMKAIGQVLNGQELPVSAIRDFIKKKAVVQFKDDLIHNRIADLHFLPSCPPLFVEPHVVMIRYVAMCSKKFIHAAAACVNQPHWDDVRARESSVDFSISKYLPERLARLKSPFLESLMARFGSLFARVGTRDIDPDYISEFLDKEI